MSSDVVVVGAGGHAKVCVELLRAMGENVVYCVGTTDSPERCMGVSVLQGDDNLSYLRSKGLSRAFVAVGTNRLRSALGALCLAQGYQLVSAISPDAVISPSASLGRGVAVMAGAVINAASAIEEFAIVNTGATVDHDCRIASAVHLGPQCALAGGVTVGQQSFLGVGSRVIPGINVGERVVVGAGAVVISDIATDMTVAGVPAKTICSTES